MLQVLIVLFKLYDSFIWFIKNYSAALNSSTQCWSFNFAVLINGTENLFTLLHALNISITLLIGQLLLPMSVFSRTLSPLWKCFSQITPSFLFLKRLQKLTLSSGSKSVAYMLCLSLVLMLPHSSASIAFDYLCLILKKTCLILKKTCGSWPRTFSINIA